MIEGDWNPSVDVAATVFAFFIARQISGSRAPEDPAGEVKS
jgi:hypothetical protein